MKQLDLFDVLHDSEETEMAELRSIQDAARGMPLTVDSSQAHEIYRLTVENGKLRDRIKKLTEAKDGWRWWALVGLIYGSLMMGSAAYYRFL